MVAADEALERGDNKRNYIGKGLRINLARLDEGSVSRLNASLKRNGVADSFIQQALAETDQAT